MRSLRKVLMRCSILAVAVVSAPGQSSAEQLRFSADPDQVRRRAEQLKDATRAQWFEWNSVTVQFRITSTETAEWQRILHEERGRPGPPYSVIERSADYTYSRHDQKVRLSIRNVPGGGSQPAILATTTVFDGDRQIRDAGLTGQGGRPEFWVGSDRDDRFLSLPSVLQGPYLASAVIEEWLDEPRRAAILTELILDIDDQDRITRLEVQAGELVREVLSFSPEHDNLMTQYECYHSGALVRTRSQYQFEQFEGRWFPVSGVERGYYSQNGELLQEFVLLNVLVEVDAGGFPEETFQLEIPANAVVWNRDTNRIVRDPELIERELREIGARRGFLRWVIPLNVAALILLGVYLYLRRPRASAQ